jgi:Tfp pilus assembly protein FimT
MHGLSTLELVICVGIALSISAVAIPSIGRTLRMYQLNDAASQVASILKLTRFEAIRRNTPVKCVNAQASANGPASVWSDSNWDGIAQPTEKQILLGANATLVSQAVVPSAAALAPAANVPAMTALNPGSDAIKFDQRGAVSPSGVYVIYVGNAGGSNSGFRAVIVLPSGSVQVWTYTGGPSKVWQPLS